MDTVNWEEEYYKLKKVSDDLVNTLKSMIDASHIMQKTLKLQEDMIYKQKLIIDKQADTIVTQTATINRLDELTERQCTNNKLMLEQMESQSKTLQNQNKFIKSAVLVKIDGEYRQN